MNALMRGSRIDEARSRNAEAEFLPREDAKHLVDRAEGVAARHAFAQDEDLGLAAVRLGEVRIGAPRLGFRRAGRDIGRAVLQRGLMIAPGSLGELQLDAEHAGERALHLDVEAGEHRHATSGSRDTEKGSLRYQPPRSRVRALDLG